MYSCSASRFFIQRASLALGVSALLAPIAMSAPAPANETSTLVPLHQVQSSQAAQLRDAEPPQSTSMESVQIDAVPSRRVWARTASDSLLPMLVAGELVLLADNRDGKRLATRGAGALVSTYAATTVLKKLFKQKRQEREAMDSFPSGHASMSFAMASVLGTYKPNYAVPAYGAATTISLSRIELREHRWH
ncbi:MAG: hypothetical protein JWN98_1150, partial [Abditibacteriota bacterium]|nr:hypothetical protein [Abditibacteriota bacterium]